MPPLRRPTGTVSKDGYFTFFDGVSLMPKTNKRWTADDVARLKNLAGKLSAKEIASALGRSPGATMVEASKLKISLRHRFQTTANSKNKAGLDVPS
jgi:hypothetical protein